jgi:hypothetical protein
MKLAILTVIAISLGMSSAAPADNYDILAAKGYRWVAVHGPYASTTEQGVERISDRRTRRTESQILEDEQTFYLIPGKIVQIIKEDRATGMSQVQMGGFTTFLWTYSRFLSKHPIRDIYGVVETPENSALVPNPGTAITRNLDGQPAVATRQNGEEGSAVRH